MLVSAPTYVPNTPVGPLFLYPDDLIGKTLAEGKFWDGDLLLPLFAEVKQGEWVVNIGAYIGHEAIYLAEQRGAYVVAVEPNKPVFDLMKVNLALHNLATVYPLNYAAYNTSGMFSLIPGQPDDRRTEDGELDLAAPGSVGSLGFIPSPTGTVPGGSLDYFVPDLLFDKRVSLIECDAQGCDLRALQGLLCTISKWRPTIVFEYEPSMAQFHGDTWEDHLKYFDYINYSLEESKTHGGNWIGRPR